MLKMMENKLSSLEKKIGVVFEDKVLLNLALVHRSYTNESKEVKEHNERLEFLGDAVLELITTEFLFAEFPEKPEGELTNHRSALVKGDHLAKVAKRLGLGKYLHLSKGEEASGGRKKEYILANAVEALIGAMYLDKGYEAVKRFVYKYILVDLDEIMQNKLYIDAKSCFQEMAQERRAVTPTYEMIKESGPDHAKIFVMGAYLGEEKVSEGKGSNKQSAEQEAARRALEKLGWE